MKITLKLKWAAIAYFCSVFIFLSAQTPLAEAARQADVPPAWPGCDPHFAECTKSRLTEFISINLQIPPEAKAQNLGGVVLMEFVVEKTGMIGEVKAMHDPGLGLGAEATRVINLMKSQKIKWIPAEEDDKKIAYRYSTPVSFNVPISPKEKPKKITATDSTGVLVYEVVEQMPRFAGCDSAVHDSINCTHMKVISHFKSNLKYPEEAFKNKTQGQVVVEFIVDATGAVTKPKIIESLGFGCDEEALRLVGLMPTWQPGRQNGIAVPVRMKVPVVFQLGKE